MPVLIRDRSHAAYLVEKDLKGFFPILPALIGMRIGHNLYQCLLKAKFRHVLFIGIVLPGI